MLLIMKCLCEKHQSKVVHFAKAYDQTESVEKKTVTLMLLTGKVKLHLISCVIIIINDRNDGRQQKCITQDVSAKLVVELKKYTLRCYVERAFF